MKVQFCNVKPLGVIHPSIVLPNPNDLALIFFPEISGGVVADVSKPLDDHALASEAGLKSDGPNIFAVAKGLANPKLNAPARCLFTASDATLAHGLSGDTSQVVDPAGVEGVVCIEDPGHLPLSGSHVGRRNVNPWADEPLAD